MESGDYRGAIEDYDALVGMIPDASDFDLRCWARAAAGVELDQALADCNRAISMSPYDETPYVDRAIIWLRRGEPARAVSDASFALRQSSNDAAALYIRGLAKGALGDVRGANDDMSAAKAASKADLDFLAKWGLTAEMAKAAAATSDH
jgi:tetratricopeptide (TPR) repeat protein